MTTFAEFKTERLLELRKNAVKLDTDDAWDIVDAIDTEIEMRNDSVNVCDYTAISEPYAVSVNNALVYQHEDKAVCQNIAKLMKQ